MGSVAGDIMGAQAQVLSAAEISLWARTRVPKIEAVDAALWKDRTLVRAWCMRRTMFLLPSDEFAVFARGTARRSDYNLNWALSRVNSKERFDKLLADLAEILEEPRSRGDIARLLKAQGHRMKSQAGGGWGDKRTVPFVEVGGASFSVGFLLHVIGEIHAICSGPNVGNESTYVRADEWLPHWKDITQEQAEEELLLKYLRAYGPATLADFALWMGLYIRDAKPIWSGGAEKMEQVDVEGWKAEVLQSDLPRLKAARADEHVVRLLPFFDSFLLGHKSHQSVVDEKNRKKVYRPQGWVSPVLLVDGRALGTWSHAQSKGGLEVRVKTFSKLSASVTSKLREEASSLGRFLGSPDARTLIA